MRCNAGFAAVVAAAMGLTACGGSSGPHVASLAASNGNPSTSVSLVSQPGAGDTATTTLSERNPTALVDEWATCMHSRGDPNQADPVIGSDRTIQIHLPLDAQSLSEAVHAGTAPRNQYLTAAQRALRNGQPFPQPPSQVTEVKFAECIRTNGVPTYRNPSGPDGSETNFNGTGIDPNSPQVQGADKDCTKQLDIPAAFNSALGDAGDIQVSSGPGNGVPGGPGNGVPGGPGNGVPGGPGGSGGSGASVTRPAGG